MKPNLFIAGTLWGLSVVAAGWVGKTWFSPAVLPLATEQQGVSAIEPTQAVVKSTSTTPDALEGSEDGRKEKAASYFATTSIPTSERMNRALELEDPLEKMSAFLDVLKSLKTGEDFTAALAEMSNGFDFRGRGREMSLFMTEWAKKDPLAALAASEKLPDWQGRMGASTALMTWTKTDPNAAKAWALEKGKDFKEEDGNWYMTSVIAGLAKQDLNMASAWALEQPRSKARGEMMDRLVDAYTKQRGVAAAQEWVSGLPDGAFRDGATRKVASRLTEEDPTKAATWISGLPQNDTKFGAMSDLMSRWGDKDPNAAGTWLKNLQPSKETDEPRQNFAWTIREKDPESAIAWAGTISDQKRRDKVLVDLVKDWSRRDKQGAQDYMVKNKWPETARKRAGG